MTYDVLFTDITLVTMLDKAPVLHSACLGVADGKIAYLGRKRPDADVKREIDGRGRVLMPGLINCHTHLPMTILRGYADDYDLQTWLNDYIFPAEDKLDSRSVLSGTALGVAECLRYGTTSVSDMYNFCDEICQVVYSSGIKGNIARGCTLFTDPDDDEFRFDLHQGCVELAQLHQTWHNRDGGRIKVEAAVHGEYTSNYQLWEALSGFAKNYGLGMQVHLSETMNEHDSCFQRNGLTPAQVLNCHGVFDTRTCAAHGVWLEDEDMELLARKGATVVHNPVSNMKLASGIAPVARMLEKGVNVALGTDSVASNNSHDMFREITAAALIHKAVSRDPKEISAWEALKMATVNGAKAQGREDECGRIEVGLDADLIMLDFAQPHLIPCHNTISNLVYSASGSDVIMTMVRGEILYEDGRYNTIDLTAVYKELATHALPTVFKKD